MGGTSWTTSAPSVYTDLSQAPIWCSFEGIRCGWNSSSTDYRRVHGIFLTGLLFEGYLTPIGKLTEMSYFNADSNKIYGSIPKSFFRMPKLLYLFLNDNRLTGSIPLVSSVNLLLRELSVENNRLGGSIPESLSMMKGLNLLYLGGNTFHGTIPSALSQITSLEGLLLESNRLTGTIPSTLRRLNNLRSLDLARNMLTGTIPVLDQRDLQYINLSENYLTMGSLEEVPMSTFSASALDGGINLRSNCLVFRNPVKPSQNVDATNCRGKQLLQNSCCYLHNYTCIDIKTRYFSLYAQEQLQRQSSDPLQHRQGYLYLQRPMYNRLPQPWLKD
jgi:Leucine-rich repeat (LRR) protein